MSCLCVFQFIHVCIADQFIMGIFVCQYFSYSEGLCLSFSISFAVQMLLRLIRSCFLISGLFSIILRRACKKYLMQLIENCVLLKYSSGISQDLCLHLEPYIIGASFWCMLLASLPISSCFSWFEKPPHCHLSRLFSSSIVSLNGGEFPFVHILSTTYCLWRF